MMLEMTTANHIPGILYLAGLRVFHVVHMDGNSSLVCTIKYLILANIFLTQVFVATTNIGSGGTLSKAISNHPYADGTSKYMQSIRKTLQFVISNFSFLASRIVEYLGSSRHCIS